MQIAHSSIAWEHVLFKDVAVKVSNLEVYYRAVSFYLQEHPDLLVDLLKVRCLLQRLAHYCLALFHASHACNHRCSCPAAGQ